MKRIFILSVFIFSFLCIDNLSSYANQISRDPFLLLQRAIERDDIERVRSLLSEELDINKKNSQGDAPIHMAVNKQNREIIQLILEKNPDINSVDGFGRTAVFLAANSGQKEVLELLIEKGADVNIVDLQSESPLSIARKRGRTEIAEVLIAHGATDTSSDGNTNESRNERIVPERSDMLFEGEMENQRRPGNIQETAEDANQIDPLADPNEIKARIKTYEGLEKTIETVDSESRLIMRRWRDIRSDNRLTLVRNIQRQLEQEIGLIKKTALEEDANNTAVRIDGLLALRNSRTRAIVRELRDQSQEEQLNRTDTNTNTRGRTSSRGSRGTGTRSRGGRSRSGTEGAGTSRRGGDYGTNANGENNEPQEPVDIEEQNEIEQWLQADVQDYDGKIELFTAINERIKTDFISLRTISEQENAKKTTATIDGLLLARKLRYDELNRYIQEEKIKAQQEQEQTGQTDATQGETTSRRGSRGTRGTRR
ncbi:MAG: ankyrin repeat domain-containing protein [Sedimentisphaerales bacterium]|nr:ankyrin repeat domain-containing protein [Sedimentisphaerales bacterium]